MLHHVYTAVASECMCIVRCSIVAAVTSQDDAGTRKDPRKVA
jgi:hypothetical protein